MNIMVRHGKLLARILVRMVLEGQLSVGLLRSKRIYLHIPILYN